jgi:hypothetical protein
LVQRVHPHDRFLVAREGSGTHLRRSSIRSHYYTSITGSYEDVDAVKESLWSLGFEPVAFKRSSDTRKAKGVDITRSEEEQVGAFLSRHGTSREFAIVEVRRLNAEAQRLNAESRRQAALLRQVELVDGVFRFLRGLLFLGVSLVMFLGLLYGLVRFVKWAWTD